MEPANITMPSQLTTTTTKQKKKLSFFFLSMPTIQLKLLMFITEICLNDMTFDNATKQTTLSKQML